jgi:hypothetical protein
MAEKLHLEGRHDWCDPMKCGEVEGVVLQMLKDGVWQDYSRGTLSQVRKFVFDNKAGQWRGVHWIGKTEVLVAPRKD